MAGMARGVTKRVIKAGRWALLKRVIKPIPVVGSLLAVVAFVSSVPFMHGPVHLRERPLPNF